MELITTHTHTCFTNHGEGTVEELVSAAVAAGVSTIAVTEHYPMTATFDPDRYLSMLDSYLSFKEEFPESTHIKSLDRMAQQARDYLDRNNKDNNI